MTPEAVKEGYVPRELWSLFLNIREAFERLPDFQGEKLTCHAVCEAFATRFGVICVDGVFGRWFDHSWLIHQDHPKVVMDIYPVAGGAPIIVYTGLPLLPWGNLYVQKPITYDTSLKERQVRLIGDYLR